MSYHSYLPCITSAQFANCLAQYTKSKAKDKSKIVETICEHLNNLENIYNTTKLDHKTMFSEFLKRRICIYSCDLVLLLIENEDYKGLEVMLKKECCQPDEILIITSVFAPGNLTKCVENLKVCKDLIIADPSFWKNQSITNDCKELNDFVDRYKEQKEQKEKERLDVKQDLNVLCDKMRQLGLSKEEILRMLSNE